MEIGKWGDDLAVRIPAAVVQALGLKAGDEVEVVPADAQSFAVRKKAEGGDFMAQVRRFRGLMPEGFVFVREDAHER